MLAVKNVRKLCEGKLHARFDEGWVATPVYSVLDRYAKRTDLEPSARSTRATGAQV